MKKCFTPFAVLIWALLLNQNSFATTQNLSSIQPFAASHEDFHYTHYYQVKEDPRVAIVDLMNFADIKQDFPLPVQPYNRLVHFGTWINYPNDHECLNTRNKVLQRESKDAVTFSPDGCAVQSGHWDDPYTGTQIDATKDIQIDHFVPLKNVYMTGGHEWDSAKRCLYANYMGNSFHLLAVNGTQNMIKGDQNPMGYMPPNKKYACQYLKQWLQVKVIWALRLTPLELGGIQAEFEQDGCDRADFKMSSADLALQRQYMEDNKDLCQRQKKQH